MICFGPSCRGLSLEILFFGILVSASTPRLTCSSTTPGLVVTSFDRIADIRYIGETRRGCCPWCYLQGVLCTRILHPSTRPFSCAAYSPSSILVRRTPPRITNYISKQSTHELSCKGFPLEIWFFRNFDLCQHTEFLRFLHHHRRNFLRFIVIVCYMGETRC